MKVLIGIVTYNRADILCKAIQSALHQDYSHKEVAVYDDASSDKTWQLKEKFPQVRWVRASGQQGYLPARNHLMRETDADFYVSLDDDAWFTRGDEISIAIELMREHPEVAAIAFDTLSPDYPQDRERSSPIKTHMFIGCGHLVRLAAVHNVGYYTPSPGFYGGEEKDLCIRLINRNFEVMLLPGVHVWHDKTMEARDISAQHRSGVCNDFVFVLRRCPFPMLLWLLPMKFLSHLRFSTTHGLLRPCLQGMMLFIMNAPRLLSTRSPVTLASFREFRRRSRVKASD